MRRVAAKFVPNCSIADQKQHRINIANEMLDSVRDDPNLLQRVITGDEAWVYGYDVEPKLNISMEAAARTKTEKSAPNSVECERAWCIMSSCHRVRTVNKEYYLQVMRNLREAIRQKRPDLWKNKNWRLHHDNAPAHTSLLVRDFLAKNNTLMMPRSHRIPQIWTPCDFFLFPKLKRPMKGRRYATLDEIKTALKEELKNILKNDFLKCFEDWKKPLAQGWESNPQCSAYRADAMSRVASGNGICPVSGTLLKLEEDKDMQQHITTMMELVDKLRTIGETLKDSHITAITALLASKELLKSHHDVGIKA
ncbi:hypothetical protein LAZ67_13001188 [Cordylochernes scorpioides]|uniref:Transposase n=1 Tax=Cordylochernes scorpioides TaxID=51811 RepID=A0ABY6L4F3_9ARAC|nr:hypothetical protein LAZ67_13001188 [Cordylochernes scorpioides]